MGLSIFDYFRLLFILCSYPVVCLAFWSFAPSEQMEQTLTKPSHVSESRLQVQKLLNLESEVITFCWLIIEQDEMLHRADASHHDSEHIKRFLTETQRINDVTLSSADVIERHPMLVFRLKRRIKVSWLPIIEDIGKCEYMSTVLETSIGFRFTQLSSLLFRESDLSRPTDDILFLQRFYCLPTVSLVAGCIHGACVEPLTLDEVKDIAQSAVDKEDHKLALEWIETRLSPFCGQNCPTSSADEQLGIMTMRASALLMERRYEEAKKAYHELYLRSNSSSKAIASILRTIEERLKKNNDGVNDQMSDHKNNAVFECDSSPCNTKQTKDDELSLTCYSLKPTAAENTTINVEILNRDPKVVIIYDFLRTDQIELLRTTTKRKDATISGIYSTPTVHRIRLSSDDQGMDLIGSHYRNITYTESTDWMEIYKDAFHLTVTSIGFGQKNPFISLERERTDERQIFGTHFGQFYVFLNEPEIGGCLIFPKLKVTVQPKQGAAVFWQSRSPSSPRVNEAFRELLECPVLLGTQWVEKIPLLHPGLGMLNF